MRDVEKIFNEYSLGINKSNWEKYAETIYYESDEKLKIYLPIMLDWIENPEIPGFLNIYYRLQKFSKLVLEKILKNKINQALLEKKYIWCLWMIELLDNDEEKVSILEKIKKVDSRFLILDMLNLENDADTQNHGVELGKAEIDFEIFIQPYTPQYGQNVWESCAKIICAKSDKELQKYLLKILMWLQDLNWYGANLILERLSKFSPSILDSPLNESIHVAIDSKDSSWLYNLTYLIVDKDEKNRINLIAIDIEIENEEKLYLERKGFSLEEKYINDFLNDINVKYLKIGALSALQKVSDNTFIDFFNSLKDDSEEHIRRIAEKAIKNSI